MRSGNFEFPKMVLGGSQNVQRMGLRVAGVHIEEQPLELPEPGPLLQIQDKALCAHFRLFVATRSGVIGSRH
jgi:hypothetical protein